MVLWDEAWFAFAGLLLTISNVPLMFLRKSYMKNNKCIIENVIMIIKGLNNGDQSLLPDPDKVQNPGLYNTKY
jgi:hypothetical protein